MAFEEALKKWEGKLAHPLHSSQWRLVNTSSMSLRGEAKGHSYQATIHSPAWMDLMFRLRGQDLVSAKVSNTVHWDLLLMAISQVELTLQPCDTYLPVFNSHQTQDGPLNNFDEVHKWMQLHRPDATNDNECGNLEFLCTLNTASPERMMYLLELCKEKKTAHLRRTLLETQDLLRIPLSFWEGVSHQTNRGGWWVRALSEELTSKCGKCKRTWPALQLAKEGCTDFKAISHRRQISPKKKKGAKPKLQYTLGIVTLSAEEQKEIKNIPSQSHLELHPHTAPYSVLFGGHDARDGYIGGRRPH